MSGQKAKWKAMNRDPPRRVKRGLETVNQNDEVLSVHMHELGP